MSLFKFIKTGLSCIIFLLLYFYYVCKNVFVVSWCTLLIFLHVTVSRPQRHALDGFVCLSICPPVYLFCIVYSFFWKKHLIFSDNVLCQFLIKSKSFIYWIKTSSFFGDSFLLVSLPPASHTGVGHPPGECYFLVTKILNLLTPLVLRNGFEKNIYHFLKNYWLIEMIHYTHNLEIPLHPGFFRKQNCKRNCVQCFQMVDISQTFFRELRGGVPFYSSGHLDICIVAIIVIVLRRP